MVLSSGIEFLLTRCPHRVAQHIVDSIRRHRVYSMNGTDVRQMCSIHIVTSQIQRLDLAHLSLSFQLARIATLHPD